MNLPLSTEEILEVVFKETLLAYTKIRYISDEEIEDFKKFFYRSFERHLISQSYDETGVSIKLK